MDFIYSTICWAIYNRALDKSDPEERHKLGLTYWPKYLSMPYGLTLNLNWYRDLCKATGLQKEESMIIVTEPKNIPASFNTSHHDLDYIRKIHAASHAFKLNLERSKAYKEIESEEFRCQDKCGYGPDVMEPSGLEYDVCRGECKMPIKNMKKEVEEDIKSITREAHKCLLSHSLFIGDEDEKAFDECVHSLGNWFINEGTTEPKFKERIAPYIAAFHND